VDKHQGVLQCDSAPGQGTIFYIRFPVVLMIKNAHDETYSVQLLFSGDKPNIVDEPWNLLHCHCCKYDISG